MAGLTPPRAGGRTECAPVRTRETVPRETPASRATSWIVGGLRRPPALFMVKTLSPGGRHEGVRAAGRHRRDEAVLGSCTEKSAVRHLARVASVRLSWAEYFRSCVCTF